MNHWPFPWDHLGEAHAYQLTHCGTPCVFYDHFMNGDLQPQIKALIKLRKKHGIANRSKVCTLTLYMQLLESCAFILMLLCQQEKAGLLKLD